MMEYRINVSKLTKSQGKTRYIHLFCAEQLGIYSANLAYYEIKAKFPEPEYKVTFEVWENRGKEVDADEYFENLFRKS